MVFDVASAEIGAGLSDPRWSDRYNGGREKDLRWSVTVDTAPRVFGEEEWAPRLTLQNLPLPLTNWTRLDRVDLTGPVGETLAYDWEHRGGETSRLALRARDGDTFHISWTGTCEVDMLPACTGRLPFHVEAIGRFSGIAVYGSDRDDLAALRTRLAAVISPDNLHADGMRVLAKGSLFQRRMVWAEFLPVA